MHDVITLYPSVHPTAPYLNGLGVEQFDGDGHTNILAQTLCGTVQMISIARRHQTAVLVATKTI